MVFETMEKVICKAVARVLDFDLGKQFSGWAFLNNFFSPYASAHGISVQLVKANGQSVTEMVTVARQGQETDKSRSERCGKQSSRVKSTKSLLCNEVTGRNVWSRLGTAAQQAAAGKMELVPSQRLSLPCRWRQGWR